MRDEKRQIVDQEDVIVVGSDVTLGELLASEYIRTQAKALADGIREDLRHGLAEKNGPIRQIFFQDISCGCRNRGQAPCQKDGGTCSPRAGHLLPPCLPGSSPMRLDDATETPHTP